LPESLTPGVDPEPQIEHEQPTLSTRPVAGASRFPLSSTARVRIVVLGFPWATQPYLQLVVPVAGCQLVPPSVETSTPATMPPPASDAVPETVIEVPSPTVA